MSRDSALLEAFAAELKARRAVLKWSQEELAFRAEVNRTYIAKLELAQNQPTLSVLHSLATAFNSDMPELLGHALRRYNRKPPESGLSSFIGESLQLHSEATKRAVADNAINRIGYPEVNDRKRQIVLEVDYMSGGIPLVERLTEVAAVELINGKVTGTTFHAYLNPGDKIDSYMYSKFKWTHDFLVKQPLFSQIASNLVEFIAEAEILTHTSYYPHLRILSDELTLLGYLPLTANSSKSVSTYALARKLLKIKAPTLTKLCNRFGVDPSQYMLQPNSMRDARLLAEVYVRMCPTTETKNL